jgi:hypothetical protein
MGIGTGQVGAFDPWDVGGFHATIVVTMAGHNRIRRRSWLPSRQLARRSRGLLLGGTWLHLRTRWRAAELDRRLADGADPILSDELSLRAGQLGSLGTRVRLAVALRDAVEVAQGRHAPLLPRRLQRQAIHENEDLILALSARLHDGEPVGVQGLAMISRLVDDRGSSLYRPVAGTSLQAQALRIASALDGGHRTAGTSGR